MKAVFVFILAIISSSLQAQTHTLHLTKSTSPTEMFSADMVLFAPVIEPQSEYGVFFSQKKASQYLNIFSLRTDRFLIETISTARKKNTGGSLFVTQDMDEVVFSASLYSKKGTKKTNKYSLNLDGVGEISSSSNIITYLSYAFINDNGKAQIQTLLDTDQWKAAPHYRSEEFKYINYPLLIKLKGKFLSVASNENGIVYGYSNKTFDLVYTLKKNANNKIYTAPVLSSRGKYLAFMELDLAANKSSIIVKEISIKNGQIQFKNIMKIDYGTNSHCQSPSFSPDETKIAYFSNQNLGDNLYAIYYSDLKYPGTKDKLAATKAFPNTLLIHGPAWVGNNILLYVKHSAREKYPIYYKDLRSSNEQNLNINTLMNKDPIVWKKNGVYNLLYISIGKADDRSLTKNKIYLAKLKLQ